MRLSDAIALGRTIIYPCLGGGQSGQNKGCALQMALAAVGRPDVHWSEVGQFWPWIDRETMESIWRRFDRQVMKRKTETLDQLIDWVRSIEPPEPDELAMPERGAESALPMSESGSPQEVKMGAFHYLESLDEMRLAELERQSGCCDE